MTCNYKACKRDILYRHRIALITRKLHGIPPNRGKEDLRNAVTLISKNGLDREYFKLQSLHDNLEKQWLDIRYHFKREINALFSSKKTRRKLNLQQHF